MTEKDFENSKIPLPIVRVILKESCRANDEVAYRLVNTTNSKELSINNFLPTFLEVFDELRIQENVDKKEIRYFGLSLFFTYNNIMQFKISIPKLRKKVVAVGHLSSKKGSIGKPEKNTHFQYYLFDPIKMNPNEDFELHKNGGEII